MTYLFDQTKAMAVLTDYEKQWGGTMQERMAATYASYAAKYGAAAPAAPDDDAAEDQANAPAHDDEPATPVTDAASPAPEPEAPLIVVQPAPVPPAAPATPGAANPQ